MNKFILLLGILVIAFGCTKSNEKGKAMENKVQDDTLTYATISTRFGEIEIQLFTNDAPKTTKNFIELSKRGYYNGVLFHRVALGFVIQGGDSTGTGAGGISIYGGRFEDELNPATSSYQEGYVRGTVAMANSGPNTNTSQFFIMLTDLPDMPKNYTIFGKVVKGMDVADVISYQEITPVMGPNDGKPVEPIKMDSVKIERKPGKVDNIFEVK